MSRTDLVTAILCIAAAAAIALWCFSIGTGQSDRPRPDAIPVKTPTAQVLETLVGERVMIEGRIIETKACTVLVTSDEWIMVDAPRERWIYDAARLQVAGTLLADPKYGCRFSLVDFEIAIPPDAERGKHKKDPARK